MQGAATPHQPAAIAKLSGWSKSGSDAVLQPVQPSVAANLLTSGLSVGVANAATNPLDVLRVRLSLDTTTTANSSTNPATSAWRSAAASRAAHVDQHGPKHAGHLHAPTGNLHAGHAPTGSSSRGLIATGLHVVRKEGAGALWRGLLPSLGCGLFIGGTRLGMYTPLKDAMMAALPVSASSSSSSTNGAGTCSGGSAGSAAGSLIAPPLAVKLGAACLGGSVASAVWSPLELIKTRLQAAPMAHAIATGSGSAGAPGAPLTLVGAVRGVVKADGVAGLWRGAMPAASRTAVLTAAQCVTYDEVKRLVITQTGWSDMSPATHFTSSLVAGLVTTTLTNPIEVVKTRLFMAGRAAAGGTRYGAYACAADVLRREGAAGFFKGWSAAYARIGPHTVLMFMSVEWLRKAAGLQSF